MFRTQKQIKPVLSQIKAVELRYGCSFCRQILSTGLHLCSQMDCFPISHLYQPMCTGYNSQFSFVFFWLTIGALLTYLIYYLPWSTRVGSSRAQQQCICQPVGLQFFLLQHYSPYHPVTIAQFVFWIIWMSVGIVLDRVQTSWSCSSELVWRVILLPLDQAHHTNIAWYFWGRRQDAADAVGYDKRQRSVHKNH